MSIVLIKPNLSRYSVSGHLEYHKVTYLLCNKYASVIQAPDLLAAYQKKVAREESVYAWVRSSEYTKRKAEADRERGDLYSAIVGLVHVNLKNLDLAIRNDARHVDNLMTSYSDLPHAGYDSRTAGIESLVARLRSDDYFAASTALGLVPWMDGLEMRNNLFKSYAENTAQEQMDKPDFTARTARGESDRALRQITSRVTALINLGEPDAYTAFAGEFNTLANHYNTLTHEHYGRLHARIDLSTVPSRIASVDPQAFTGKHVCIIPEISLVLTDRNGGGTKTVELVFTEDFTVSYKNNIGPGTATLVIRGIGNYSGKLTTTFNINKKNA
ncbi:MAG: DUF6261 family protein [Tannerella sp.]|jgi:hypothetical protein|nr:DUF6261 family protein [Tannerella sp.]